MLGEMELIARWKRLIWELLSTLELMDFSFICFHNIMPTSYIVLIIVLIILLITGWFLPYNGLMTIIMVS